MNTVVNVEVLLRDEHQDTSMEAVTANVQQWLHDRYDHLFVNSTITDLDMLADASSIERIDVVDVLGMDNDTECLVLKDVSVKIFAYSHRETDKPRRQRRVISQSANQEDPDDEGMSTTILPNRSFDSAWKLLVYDDPFAARLLNYITRLASSTDKAGLFGSRLVLLFGPPGSGKTTLCHALAQKAAIRLSDKFTESRFIELDASSLLSKFFGESGKHVIKAFENIRQLAAKSGILIFVLIDEVETIAGCRTASMNGSDCKDGLRATNQLLKELDSFQSLGNVFFFCTSNLVEAIDPAFLDRVGVRQLVRKPNLRERYTIIRSCLVELQRNGSIRPENKASETITPNDTIDAIVGPPTIEEFMIDVKTGDEASTEPTEGTHHVYILTFVEALSVIMLSSAPRLHQMMKFATASDGLSGRDLRRLPTTAWSMYVAQDACDLDGLLAAMEKVMARDDWGGKNECYY